MCLFTSHTKPNPNRKFWGCPKWTVSQLCGVISYGEKECLFTILKLFSLHVFCTGRIWMHLPLERQSLDWSLHCFECGAMSYSRHPSWFAELSTNLDGLKREIETKNRHEQLEMEGKHEKKKLVAKQLLMLEKNFYVLLLTAFLICDAISMRYM